MTRIRNDAGGHGVVAAQIKTYYGFCLMLDVDDDDGDDDDDGAVSDGDEAVGDGDNDNWLRRCC